MHFQKSVFLKQNLKNNKFVSDEQRRIASDIM